jgi:hypothetical protein
MVRYLKTSHAGAVHRYASQEQYHDFHDGDTDEEIEMELAPLVVPNLIIVSDKEEDLEEMIPEEDEPTEQPNLEEQAPGEDLEDHPDQEMEEEEQEQEQKEEAEDVFWEVYHYRADGVGIPMADHLRAMALRSVMIRPLFTIVSCGLIHGSSPIGKLLPSWRSTFHAVELGRCPSIMMWLIGLL